ncbi:MAG: CheR family methyltransferase [Pseudomonadota bacterium]
MNLGVQHLEAPDGSMLCKINLLGRLERPEEMAELQKRLAKPGALAIEIACFDADTLPAVVIEAIAAALDRGIDVKVRAYRHLLVYGLLRLSLPVLSVLPVVPPTLPARCRALALAGSANSLDKILVIVEGLLDSDAALFVVQHVREDQTNLLDQLLKVRTHYSVVMPQHLVAIQPHTLYVAPPGHHMKVAHGLVYLTRDRKIGYARPSIDVLFESLAAEYGVDLLAVVLCGYGQDGVAGCAAVRASGGCVLVEDASECEGAGLLPDSVCSAGHFDVRLKHRGITSLAAAALSPRSPAVEDPLLERFLDALHEQSGYDFRGYQRGTLTRRISHFITTLGFASFFDCQRAVLSNPQLTERLLTELSINVTEFFRHPQQFRRLRETVLPYLASFPLIKIWSAGCATGEEAYSLAMLLDELGLLEKSRIFATDINSYLLELAQAGLFPKEVLNKSRDHYHEAGGTDLSRHIEDHGRYLKVAQRYRERVLFHHHALGQDGVFNEFQLILCRNVMIYFDLDLQRRVFGLFTQSLHREGFLLLGPSDGLRPQALACGFKPNDPDEHLYRYLE